MANPRRPFRTASKSGDTWRRLCGDAGENLIEFALGSVLFFMFIFGTVEFGIGVWHYNMLSNLAQEGARWASVRGSNGTAAPAPATTSADVEAFVRGRAQGINLTSVTATPDPGTITTGAIVTVQVTENYGMSTPLIPIGGLTLSSTAQMVMAR